MSFNLLFGGMSNFKSFSDGDEISQVLMAGRRLILHQALDVRAGMGVLSDAVRVPGDGFQLACDLSEGQGPRFDKFVDRGRLKTRQVRK